MFTVQVDLTNGYTFNGILPAYYQISKHFYLQFVSAKISAQKYLRHDEGKLAFDSIRSGLVLTTQNQNSEIFFWNAIIILFENLTYFFLDFGKL